MDQNLIKRGETALAKSNVAAYIHDMKELEIKQFTLIQLAVECVKKYLQINKNNNKKIEESKRKLLKIEQHYSQEKNTLNTALQNRKNKPKKPIQSLPYVTDPLSKTSRFFLYSAIFALISHLIDVLILYPYQEKNNITLPTSTILAISVIVLIIIIVLQIINHKIKISRHNIYSQQSQEYKTYKHALSEFECQEKNIETLTENCNRFKKDYENAQEELNNTKKQTSDTQPLIQELQHMKEFLMQHISSIEQQKNQLYSLNIVPPDYRTLDCMIEFDQMFRNDLVDTMRQAVMIYEERVFRGEVIRGIDKIYDMLGNLNATMSNIENVLYSVQNEVSKMSDDLEQIVFSNNQIATANKKFQDDMISESRAARYATEALKDTTDRCEWYMNRQYWKTNYN